MTLAIDNSIVLGSFWVEVQGNKNSRLGFPVVHGTWQWKRSMEKDQLRVNQLIWSACSLESLKTRCMQMRHNDQLGPFFFVYLERAF